MEVTQGEEGGRRRGHRGRRGHGSRSKSSRRKIKCDAAGEPISIPVTFDTAKDGIGDMTWMQNYLMAKTTMNRGTVVAEFSSNLGRIHASQSLTEIRNLTLNNGDTFQRIHSRGTRPVVEICEGNRIEIQTLHRFLCDRLDGKFLLCRTISRAVNGVWVEVVVDDPCGNAAAILRLTNFTSPRYSVNAGKRENDYLGVLPQGSFIAVKNPYGVMGKKGPPPIPLQVSCHSPTDVVILSPKKLKELLPDLTWNGFIQFGSFWRNVDQDGETDAQTMEKLKRKGNEDFIVRRYTDALRWYELGLDYVGDGTGIDLWSNKAAAYLELGCFEKGLECCEKVLRLDPCHAKAVYRKVKCLAGLDRVAEGLTFLKGKLKAEPTLMENKDLNDLGTKITELEVLPPMRDIMGSSFFRDFGSDFLGPIEFRASPGSSVRGGGIFAIHDISPGDPVLLQRTFAEVGKSEGTGAWGGPLHVGTLTRIELVEVIANKIALSPQLGPEFYSLWAGKKLKSLESQNPESRVVNVERIDKIVKLHSRFCFNRSAAISTTVAGMRHTCADGNVFTMHVQNWVFVVATKSIKKGEEILSQFVESGNSPDTRHAGMRKLGIKCKCRLCVRESKDNSMVKAKYNKLVDQLGIYSLRNYTNSTYKMNAGLDIVNQLAALRKDAPDLNPILVEPCVRDTLVNGLLVRKMYPEYVDICQKIFLVAESLNHPHLAYNFSINLMRAYLIMDRLEEGKAWARKSIKYAYIAYRTPMILDAWLDWSEIAEDHIKALRNAGINVSQLFAEVQEDFC